MNAMKKSEVGKCGERMAARYLSGKGYEIVVMNYRTPYGEIDIIAKNEAYIVFAEVKTRSTGSIFKPYEAVNRQKQIRLMRTAMLYMMEKSVKMQPRFDVISIEWNPREENPAEIRHFENAFGLEETYEFI